MNKDIVLKWYKQACHDLEMAEKNISIKGYDISAFLAHQAIEKLFKALLAMRNETIPKIHYIDELARRLSLSNDIIEDVMDLTPDYM
ncbi:MAG: HEPN domain-containing protein [Candidatus Lokiarchaeota archaeon]|nr:HEPN domain-containing protein [Candidatus Lokiarchaeota archaeon]